MSATSVSVQTLVFPNPEWNNGVQDFQSVNSSVSYNYFSASDIRTLSTNTAEPGDGITGLLYVPTITEYDACWNASEQYVPTNVTRRANLPDVDYNLIAIAPWLSPSCVLEYLTAARNDPVRSFLFYLPSATDPPTANSDIYSLGDNEDWKKTNHFPVYVTDGPSGQALMNASSKYSGNMTDVPYGHDLTEYYDSRDYVRLFVTIGTAGGTSLPSLWVFLLIVLGILLAVICLTSGTMHWLQRRRRETLRRRVANGEVDLEALGIKRLTVPQELLDKMPLYTYGTLEPVSPSAAAALDTSTDLNTVTVPPKSDVFTVSKQPSTTLVRGTSFQPGPLQQPTCAICLDDFVPASSSPSPPPPTNDSSLHTSGPLSEEDPSEGTIVRELPCHHIFHPECVDSFLRDSSSLCPMCKKSALPKGYCPRVVTNAMVRRERMVRRLRPLVVDSSGTSPASATTAAAASNGRHSSILEGRRRFRSYRGFRHHLPSAGMYSRETTEMAATPPMRITTGSTLRTPPPPPLSSLPAAAAAVADDDHPATATAAAPLGSDPPPLASTHVQPPSTPGRGEWARQRAVAMLGRQRAPLDPDAEDASATPGWRKVVGGLFPSVDSVGAGRGGLGGGDGRRRRMRMRSFGTDDLEQ